MHALPARWAVAVVALVALSAVASAACADDSNVTLEEAVLVAPPNVPPPLARNEPRVVSVHLQAVEKTVEIASGVQYRAWTFNGSIPGPLIRVRVGDLVQVHLANATDSEMTHNIDLHAVNGPGGGAGATTVAPGEEKAFTFRAMAAGLYVYHCAAGIVADHIANGMYGAILVEPADGLPHVDHEYYVGQGEFYTTGETGDRGEQALDTGKLLSESPEYVVFNGNTKALAGEAALMADVGETVRLFVANGGPNLISSFHVIGEIFDRAWNYGAFNEPLRDIQTILVPPGGAAIVEFKLDVAGDYKLVDHAISRVSKGALGTLHVTGPTANGVFNGGASASTGHDMTPPATTSPTAAPTSGTVAPGNTVRISMRDNLFEPTQVTVRAGSSVTFDLPNEGKVIHNMRIADATGNYDGSGSVISEPQFVSPGKSGTLKWQAPQAPGSYRFRCDVHPDQMTGVIVVQ